VAKGFLSLRSGEGFVGRAKEGRGLSARGGFGEKCRGELGRWNEVITV
jgi:hypothetical protein